MWTTRTEVVWSLQGICKCIYTWILNVYPQTKSCHLLRNDCCWFSHKFGKIRIWEHAVWSWEVSTGLTLYITFRLWLVLACDHKEQKQVINSYIFTTEVVRNQNIFSLNSFVPTFLHALIKKMTIYTADRHTHQENCPGEEILGTCNGNHDSYVWLCQDCPKQLRSLFVVLQRPIR